MSIDNISGIDQSAIPTGTGRGKAMAYRIQVLTSRDDEGVYSTVALNLPGAGSCGNTPDESLANAKDAIKAVLETYQESGIAIPWREVTDAQIPEGELKVIFVHA